MGRLGPGFQAFLERSVMKVRMADAPDLFAAASPDRQVRAGAPPTFVVAGANDTLVPVEVARTFARRLAATSESPVAYAELPRAQHAFDVMVTIRSRATTLGAVRFLEWARARAGGPTPEPSESVTSAPDLA
jgi:acetyl esterase/lipase